MASTQWHEESAPSTLVLVLVQVLLRARSTTGPVSTAPAILKAISDRFRSNAEFEIKEVEALIEALDDDEFDICERLETKTLGVVCGILRLSAPCKAQHRGFFLLAEFLHEDPTAKSDPVTQERKSYLGKVILPWALRRFLEPWRDHELREALGALSFELLVGNLDNVALLTDKSQGSTWSGTPRQGNSGSPDETSLSLGECAIGNPSEILKLMAGSIIRELHSRGIPVEQFWPNANKSQKLAVFPKSQHHTSQWVFDFASFVDRQRAQRSSTQQQELMVFAAAFILEDTLYTIEGASAILVVVGERLSLAMLSITLDPSLYLDVPFSSLQAIEHSETQSQPLSQIHMSQKPTQYYLTLDLRMTGASNYHLNARGDSVNVITLVFDHPKDSRLVKDALLKHCEQPGDGMINTGMTFHTMPLNLSVGTNLDTGLGTNDAEALTGLASDAMDAMDEARSGSNNSDDHRDARNHATNNDSQRRQQNLSGEEAAEADQTSENNLQMKGSTLPTSPLASRVVPPRDLVDARADPETIQDASMPAEPGRTTNDKHDLCDPGELNDTIPSNVLSNGKLDKNRIAQPHRNLNLSHEVSFKPPMIGRVRHRNGASTTEDRSMEQIPSQTNKDQPRKPKLSQQMRDSKGQSATEATALALKESQSSQKGGDIQHTSGAIATGTIASKKSRRDALPNAPIATKNKSSKLTKESRLPVQSDGSVNIKASRATQLKSKSRPIQTSVEGPPSSKAHAESRVTTKYTSSKLANSVTQPSKAQAKHSRPPEPTQQPDGKEVNYDEAFELGDGDDNDSDNPIGTRLKDAKQQKKSTSQKKARKPPAKQGRPKATTQISSSATQKPRRQAAVKANKAIQGIVDDDAVERPLTGTSTPVGPVALPPSEAPRMVKATKTKARIHAPINANIGAIPANDNATTAPGPSKAEEAGKSLTEQPAVPTKKDYKKSESSILKPSTDRPVDKLATMAEAPRLQPLPIVATEVSMKPTPSVLKTLGKSSILAAEATKTDEPPTVEPVKAQPVVEPVTDSETSHARFLPVFAPQNPLKSLGSALKTSESPTVTGDATEAHDTSTSETPANAIPTIAEDGAMTTEKGTQAGQALSHTAQVLEDIIESNDVQQEAAEVNLGTLKHFNEGILDTAKDEQLHLQNVVLGNPQENQHPVIAEQAPYKEVEQPTVFIGNEISAEQIIPTSPWPITSKMAANPPQTHFEEAMAFVRASDDQLPSDPLQNLPTHQGELDILPSSHLQRSMEQNRHKNATKVPPAAPASVRKLESALSSVPKLYQEPKEEREKATTLTYALKVRSLAPKPGLPKTRQPIAITGDVAPQINRKRQHEPDDAKLAKRSKPVLSGEDRPRVWENGNEIDGITSENVPKNINRKPNLVHFEPTGPSNQGSSTKKPEAEVLHKRPKDNTSGLEAERGHKRSHVDGTNGDAVNPQELLEKPPKIRHLENANRVAKNPLQPSQPHRAEFIVQQRKPSSQSSRVDAFGSPQPYQHSRRTTLAHSKLTTRSDSEQLMDLDNEFEVDENLAPYYDDIPNVSEFVLPIGQKLRKSPKTEPFGIISNNSKQRPSSPLAPSIVGDLTAHKEEPGGLFVDVRTAEVVIAQKPQDPFKASDERPNPFIELLRKSSSEHAKEERKQNDQSDRNVTSQVDDDPDKTLIGAQSPGDEDSSSSSSGSSSGSGDSPTVQDDPSDVADSISRWRDALRPHQTSTLEILIEISHRITQDLVSKEDAIRNMIKDYQCGGHKLVDEYRKAREQEYETTKAKNGQERAQLLRIFQNAEKELRSEATKLRRDVADFKSHCEERERRLSASVDTLMALGTE